MGDTVGVGRSEPATGLTRFRRHVGYARSKRPVHLFGASGLAHNSKLFPTVCLDARTLWPQRPLAVRLPYLLDCTIADEASLQSATRAVAFLLPLRTSLCRFLYLRTGYHNGPIRYIDTPNSTTRKLSHKHTLAATPWNARRKRRRAAR